jgi:hypothetical protein
VPFRPTYGLDLAWTPGGDLLGRQTDDDGDPNEGFGLRLWRADHVDGGSFEVVHEGPAGRDFGVEDPPFTVLGDRLWSLNAWSDDDGRTWQEVTTWRP